MRTYRTQPGDSPATIARRHGIAMSALIGANPHKPTTVVAGTRTWQSLGLGEPIHVPGSLGDAATDAVVSLINAGSPCDQANVALVCAAQRAMGIGADGKWGNDASTAAKRYAPNAPPGCTPRPSWWAPTGQVNCPATAAAPSAAPATSSLPAAASAAAAALAADPNRCASVAQPGTAVNTAVHNFKAAWNATNPGSPVPIGTGKYESSVSAALSSALGGQVVPPGCDVAAPAPAPSAAPATAAPAAVQALISFDPCVQANVASTYAAQKALGIAADGKWGTDSSTAARRVLPGAPAGCSPRPAWWAPAGQVNYPPSAAPAPQGPVAITCPAGTALNPATGQCVAIPPPPAPPSGGGGTPPPSGGGGGAVVIQGGGGAGPAVIAPAAQQGGISTGAIVAGAVGAVALVGVIAAASMGGKGGAGHRGARGARGHAGHKPAHKKTTHRKAAHKKR